ACGCTVPSYPASIAAGGEGHVEVELDTSSLSGALAKSVKMRTNDPANPELVLTLKAEVRILVEARPGYLRFRHTLGEPAPAVAVDVWSPSRPRLEVLGVASPLPFLRARVREAAPADDGLR